RCSGIAAVIAVNGRESSANRGCIQGDRVSKPMPCRIGALEVVSFSGCRGKPAGLTNQNRMESSFSEFARRLRQFMAQTSRSDRAGAALPDDGDTIFNEMALDLFELQLERNRHYRKFCEARGVGKVDHWRQVPAAPTNAFKEFEFTSVDAGERKTVFES